MRALLRFLTVLFALAISSCGTAPKDHTIADAPAPAGVEPALWRQLTAELERQLAIRGADGPSANAGQRPAPRGTSALTEPAQLAYDSASATLSWRVAHSGDYNQDGLVSVADLTPLGAHFGARALSIFGQETFPHESIHSQIDGDGNGELNLADITPIAVNFGDALTGYRVYRSADPTDNPADPSQPNGPGAQLVATVTLDAATQTPGERRQLSAQVVPTSILQHFWVRPYSGPADGAASNSVEVIEGIVENNAPVAKLKVTPVAGLTPLEVTLDASGSTDPDGDIVKYEWDLNDDDHFEYDSGVDADVPMYYYDAGTFNAGVRVTDDGGLSSVAEVPVTVAEGKKWEKQVVYSEQPAAGYNLGLDSFFLELSSTPVFFLLREANAFPWGGGGPILPPNSDFKEILLSSPANLDATSWSQPELLHTNDGLQGIEWHVKAPAIINGDPALYFGERDTSSNTDLWLLKGASADPQSWDLAQNITPEYGFNVEDTSIVSLFDSYLYREIYSPTLYLLSSNGRAILDSFQLNDPLDIKEIQRIGLTIGGISSYSNQVFYRYTEDPTAEVWPTFPTLVYESAMGVTDAHLGSVAAHPTIVFRNNSLKSLYFVRAADPEGTSWPTPKRVTIWSEPPLLLGLTDDERPYILTKVQNADVYTFVAANDPLGNSWGMVTSVPLTELPNRDYKVGQLMGMPIFHGVRTESVAPGVGKHTVEYWQYR